MNTQLAALQAELATPGRDVARCWKWRDRYGLETAPADMDTRHLFFTLRMIWNNRMPEYMRVGPVRLYTFGPTYTRQYFAEAIIAIGMEIRTRTDMAADWRAQYEQMQAWLTSSSLRIAD